MAGYLIDNNIISNFLAGRFTESALDFVSEVIDQTPSVSIITQIEALSWVNPSKQKEAAIRSFIGDAYIIPLCDEVVKKCVSIRRAKKIRTPDAIIAATAIVHDMTLLTSDHDFQGIQGLEIIDPHDL